MITDDIIHRCQAGDSDAQRLIYEALSGQMFCVALRYAPSRAVAQDWLHDGFIQLFDHIVSFSGRGSFEGWARRVFVTTALGHLRSDKIFGKDKFVGADYVLAGVESSMAEAIDSMQSQDVMRFIGTLPLQQRTVLNLYSIEGYDHSEIAQMLGITVQNSRTTLHRAKNELARVLRREGIIE